MTVDNNYADDQIRLGSLGDRDDCYVDDAFPFVVERNDSRLALEERERPLSG
jgi:hypothetical protein